MQVRCVCGTSPALCEQVGGSCLFPAGQAELLRLSVGETNCSDVCQVFVLLIEDT